MDKRKKYENSLPKKGLFKFISIIPRKHEHEIRERCRKLREEHLKTLEDNKDENDAEQRI